ncbi:S41 family peptidase [Streptomyces sp. NPDC048172]|uniref:S41 family peptidase n=1 Tax=Streptomyces sp. NPDC048172 TaxID=3365505 RepID=UPI0037176EED
MQGSWFSAPPRRIRRGAALTLVFASVLATGAATGSWGDEVRDLGSNAPGSATRSTDRLALGGGAPEGTPEAGTADDGKGGGPEGFRRDRRGGSSGTGSDAAEELVSRSGDRWSAAYSAREYEGLRQALDGSYVGVGISVRQRHREHQKHEKGREYGKGQEPQGHRKQPRGGGREAADGPDVEVDRVEPDSPADRAGIRAGDRLRSIDGETVTGLPVTDVVARLRGSGQGTGGGTGQGADKDSGPGAAAEAGSEVTVVLRRGGREWQRTLVRERLATEPVTVDELGPGATRIKVSSFTKGSGKRVRDAVRHRVPGGSGILLDLRGNSGGLVDEAVTAASAFLDGGLVATYDDNGTQRALYAKRGGGDAARPVVVLVDGGTMSAAELLTGALQDRGRAVVVGSRTFGKGSVQVPNTMPDGSVAELTVGHYTTPAGRDVEGEGITPDLPVDSKKESTERARTVLSGLEARS